MIYTITLNPAIDRLIKTTGRLTRKKTNRVAETEYDLGGKGLHVSHALSKFGVANQALGFIGSENRTLMEAILTDKKVSHHLFVEEGASTRECIVLLDETDEGSLMITGDGFPVSEENHQRLIRFIDRHVTPNDSVVMAGSLPPGYTNAKLKEILAALKRKGCFIACDLSGEALCLAVELGVDFIKPNQHEAEELFSGQRLSLLEKLRLLADKIDYVVISLGRDGCYASRNGRIYRVTSAAVHERNDTGAGDVFVGAFMAQLVQKADFQTMLRYAVACAASKAAKQNCTDFDMSEAESLFSQIIITELGDDHRVIS
ncbi:1-phosphofructokinase family hexose kinase [Bacillus sp. HSf4]|uniref:1-phosphofructokinase family hexose kinase n=1 Tax=Bacillus sp. HSf4 TaxID=3035514 RepID=UPI002409E554|nr:1-phosphofructokinase family hexose kinase [Bacillus sp. HSf4]WFA05132.1 1-phosphofructokinase family hexose kinase [Bacillus sp. HSf4]